MKKIVLIFALIVFLISACSANTPAAAPVQAIVPQAAGATATSIPPTAAATATPSPLPPSATPAPTATATAAPDVMYFPIVTFSANVACYEGPAKEYYKTANFSIGQSTQVLGHSDDAKWLNVLTLAPNIVHTCWVPLTSVNHFPSANALQVIKAAPLPTGATLAVARNKYTCGVDPNNGVELGWIPSTTDSTFILYRNGEDVVLVYGGEYIDHKTPAAKIQYLLTYIVQAVNSVGISKFTAVTSVTICGIK